MKKWSILIVVIGVCALALWLAIQFSSQPTASKPAAAVPPPIDLGALIAKAERADPQAQVQLASLYAQGRGVTNSYAEAAKWYRRAAEQGNADAQVGLGELYEAGRGVPKDMDEAIKCYRLAADQGNAAAQYTLGFLCEAGHGLPQDQPQAAKWFKLAADQGDKLSQYDLGQRYELGVGVPLDRVEALKWFMLAAAQGQPDAAQRAEKIKTKMSRQEISEAKRRVASSSLNKDTKPPICPD